MQEINWNNFKAKFNGKEQKSFELLCYRMFCSEFGQNLGIFRYRNQVGIETEPIQYDNEWIGFQAKFYETKINKGDIKDSITKAKRKNPELDKILFYINQEFSESSKKDEKEPQYKIEIENHAESKGVEIEWRVRSHFERQLSLGENLDLAQHFFSLGKSVIDLVQELSQHTESILTPINSEIRFDGNEIKIDRSNEINQLREVLNQSSSVIVSGEAGVGKTAVIKDFYQEIKDTAIFFVFKATEFNIPSINELFKSYGDFTLADFIREHRDLDTKYVVIDSAEKLSDIEDQDTFREFLSALLNNNWKIVFATRYGYLDDLRFQFLEVYHIGFHLIDIEKLNTVELIDLSKKHSFSLPSSERLFELLRIPFYLNEYLLNHQIIDNATGFSGFKDILWNKQIAKTSYRKNNIHRKREECFLRIAESRADSGHFFVTADDCEDNILRILESDEIIKYDSNAGGYFITHDIYEEWALDRIIEREFQTSDGNENFFKAVGNSLPIRRAFRIWLSEKLFDDASGIKAFIDNTITCDDIESFWRDEILVSVLLSDYSSKFFEIFENELLADSQKLLMKGAFLLRIACKEIDQEWLNLLRLQGASGSILNTIFTNPRGSGWNCVIDFIYKHKEDLGLENIDIILPLLDDWNKKIKEGETTKQASQMALYYYDKIMENGGFWFNSRDGRKEQLIGVILQGASEVKDELGTIFEEVIHEKQISRRDKYYRLIQTILTSITDSFEVVKNLPEQVLALADLFWFKIPEKEY